MQNLPPDAHQPEPLEELDPSPTIEQKDNSPISLFENPEINDPRHYPLILGLIITIFLVYGITVFPDFSGTPLPLWLALGVFDPQWIVEGEWWRIVTGQLLHANWSHLLSNGFGLYVFGHLLEPWVGTKKTLGLVIVSGLMSDLFSYWFLPSPTLGISGVVYGLFLGYIVVALRIESASTNTTYTWKAKGGIRSATVQQGAPIGYQIQKIFSVIILIALLEGFSSNPLVNHWGHLGGAVGGVLWGLFLPLKSILQKKS
ncbi:MAG: rhomboid family intramembrane serine protease [Cyanobacteria bacterium]|nr:rhomboid family intramembrane serine protease [Cyanobacteriota bacterium]